MNTAPSFSATRKFTLSLNMVLSVFSAVALFVLLLIQLV